MKKLYEKSEIWFAVLWIIIYTLVMGNLRNNFGDASPYPLIGLLVIAIAITSFIVKNKLVVKYGLVGLSDVKKYLYFIPFVLLATVNFWFGVSMHYDLLHQTFSVITMGLVGYVEEIIFRGLLFKAIEKDSVKKAIIISAVTFGAGHIINLLTGQATADTFFQIGYAIAIGFAFVMVFYKSGSLIPCIITHSVVNITSKFSNASSNVWDYLAALFIIIVAGGYALYLHKRVK
ncbi:CPBP family intramembrane glutamic endopeptidase [Alloiococcus sp. CFN-8]|uniref:CPBP family intramembrane glutamic endopeptidase n=1 Tax=Alloiococcus sp. CFN-8 TaxID=3416081 RepID=UPI003CF89BAA